MATTTTDYCEMAKRLDDWAGYHDRFSATIRAACGLLVDGWGRMPEQDTARRAAALIRQYHGGKPENCRRAVALLECLEGIQ